MNTKEKVFENIKKHCFGCVGYHHRPNFTKDDPSCHLYLFNQYGMCPCTNCVVKVICDNDCQKLKNWAAIKQF